MRKTQEPKSVKDRLIRVSKILSTLSLVGTAGLLMVATAAYLYLAPRLPEAENYRDVRLETPLRIYTSDGLLIDEIGNRRNPITFEEIPKVLINALIATEDVRFYSHPGVDFQSLLRGFYGFMRGVNLGGGSTITMQLANNLSFDSDNVYLRKFKEIPFALQIQQELTKEEVLTLYLNTIYFGAGADGIGAAAYIYYGKHPSELTLAEAAMMVSLLPCPSTCNPLANPQRSIERRRTRLKNMVREGMIDDAAFLLADDAPITASPHGRNIEISAPFIAEMVRQNLYSQYGEKIYSQGFEVVTSIDSDKQIAATESLTFGLENYYDRKHGYRGPNETLLDDDFETLLKKLSTISKYGNQEPAVVTTVNKKSFDALLKNGQEVKVEWDGMSWAYAFQSRNEAWPPPSEAADSVTVGDLIYLRANEQQWELGQIPDIEGALVSISPKNGRILALVGGYDFKKSQVNRVLTPRPPGSNFKPFVYGAAIEEGYTAATIINDAPITRGDYRPNNYENNFLGPMTLRNALKESRNVPTVRLYDQLGSEKPLSFAAKLGIPTDGFPRNDLTIALGSRDVAPLDIVTGYASIANGGFKVDPWFIKEIKSLSGEPIYSANPKQVCVNCNDEDVPTRAPRVIDSRVAFILGSMLRSVIEEGSGARVNRELNRTDLKGKTGTTNGPQELWFSGFNENVATTVFVGFDQPQPLGEQEQGATIAVPIWIDYMRTALAGQPIEATRKPDGIVDRLINQKSGEAATPGDSGSIFEFFRVENAPISQTNGEEGDLKESITTETLF
jgi:penicillin-binding protein 1A